MFQDNVIYVDFRFSKEIQKKQVSSFAERIKAHSEHSQRNVQAARSAIEVVLAMLDKEWPKVRLSKTLHMRTD